MATKRGTPPMARSTNKRKEPPPNRTLIDFFSGADTIKRARANTARQSKTACREIIVIDSDSDDGAHAKGANNTTGAAPRSQDMDMFGAPSDLLRSTAPRTEASSDTYQHSPIAPPSDQSESIFGISAPLLEQPCGVDSQPTENSRGNYEGTTSNVGVGNSASDSTVGLPLGDWAVADDELAPLALLHSNAQIVGGFAEPFDERQRCPVCGMDLVEDLLEVQTHVNECLDKILQNDDSVMQECMPIRVSNEPDVTEEVGSGTLPIGQRSDLYTVLMSPHKEDDFWAEADAATCRASGSTRANRRKAPFYKVLQGMPIAVDAFCYGAIPGVTAYFLTHAHSDHYTNLGSKWNSGPIYCSEETASLVSHMLAVDPRWIYPLPLDTPTVIPNTGDVSVTLIEANHCPGSCLFLFEGMQTVDAGDSAFRSPFIGSSRIFRYLHCGDFRASPRHVLHPAVSGKHIDHVYLDTTYLDSKYTFAPQPLVISACAELARRLVIRGAGDNPNTHMNHNLTLDAWMKSETTVEGEGQMMLLERILVVVGTYSIGKERVVKAIAQALGEKIYCDPRKTAILRCQADKELHALLTADPVKAGVHILPLGMITLDNLKSYLQRFKGAFSRIVGFKPTGWTYSPPSGNGFADVSVQSIISRGQSRHFSYTDLKPSQKSSYNIQIFGVPYSEHSSFFELTCFVMSCDWSRMIPTVNVGSPTSRAKMAKWLKRWESEKRSKPFVPQPRTADYW